MDKKTFDFNSQISKLLSEENKSQIKVLVSNIYETFFPLANENAGKKFDIVFTESDFLKFGPILTKALKNACAEFSTLIIEDADFDHVKNKSFFNFHGEVVIVVGGYNLISVATHYASLQKKEVYAVLTEPNFEYVLLNYVRLSAGGMPVRVDVSPIKALLIDVDVMKKASNSSYQECFIGVISKLISLIDYKFRSLITGERFDNKSYQSIKNAIALVAGINTFKNVKEVLIYSELILALERANGNVLTDSSVDLYVDALGIFSTTVKNSEKILSAMRVIIELYEMFFLNDLSGLMTVADYNKDIEALEKSTGKSGSYFRKNLFIPSPRRLDLINRVINKTRGGFLKEVESVLSVMKAIEKIYYNFEKSIEEEEKLSYAMKKEALMLSTYLSDKITILTHLRDMGVLKSLEQ